MIRGVIFLVLLVVVIDATRSSNDEDEVRRDDAHRSYGEDSTARQAPSKVSYYKSKPNKNRQYLYGSRVPPPGSRVSLNNYAYYAVWRDFKSTHNKSYDTTEEESARFHVFIDNHRKIETHNSEYEAGRKSFQLGMNQFGDMTNEEFRSTMNGYKRELRDQSDSATRGSTFLVPHNTLIPTEIDWRQKGYVTHVKNQGQCGSCWAFSAVGALEGQHFRKSGTMVELSEQNLVDCSSTFGNEGCNGGLMDNAFNYVKSNKGIDTETSYPYEGKDDRCRFKKQDVGAEDTGFVDVKQGDESELEAALATVGPVSIAIDAGHESFQFYKKDVYNEPQCSSTELDHGVLAVGYGVTAQGDLYYIVKNSWGDTWGEQGYIRMSRRKNNQCGVATAASYPLV